MPYIASLSAEMEDDEYEAKIVHKDGKASESSPLLSKTASTESLQKSPSRPETFDGALELTGVGVFHCLLVLVAGWALASDSVEVQCISFVTPLLDNKEANPDTQLAPTKVYGLLPELCGPINEVLLG